MYIVWGKDMKRETHRIKPVQGAVRPNYMSGQAQTNLDKVVREIEESGTPEKPEGQVLLGGLEIDDQVHKAKSRGEKERYASEERRKLPDKVPITYIFNTLHKLN